MTELLSVELLFILGIVDKSVELLAEAEDSLTISKLFGLLGKVVPQRFFTDQIADNQYCRKRREEEG